MINLINSGSLYELDEKIKKINNAPFKNLCICAGFDLKIVRKY